MSLYEQIQAAKAYLRTQTDFVPRTGIILGTGLSGLADAVNVVAAVDYAAIPHFAKSTVASHRGQLIFGFLGVHPVVVMAGRFHYYEGWTMQQVTFPVRVMKFLGIENLIVTNVSGGINPHLLAGDLVIVRDHLNFLPENPLRGVNDERLGVRFPDLMHTYHLPMRQLALKTAQKLGIRAIEGVYSALQGPNLETPAEYEMLRKLGSDCTGMSSVPEILVAKHSDLRAMMISMVANVSFPPSAIRETSLEDVIAVAKEAGGKLQQLIFEMLQAPEMNL